MQHLNNLKLANFVFAAFEIFIGCLVGLIYIGLGVLTMVNGDTVTGVIFAVAGLVVGGIVCAMGALMIMVGRKVADGKWRIGQTILAVLSLSSFPFGTAYGAYALWVCWMNEETKGAFEANA